MDGYAERLVRNGELFQRIMDHGRECVTPCGRCRILGHKCYADPYMSKSCLMCLGAGNLGCRIDVVVHVQVIGPPVQDDEDENEVAK